MASALGIATQERRSQSLNVNLPSSSTAGRSAAVKLGHFIKAESGMTEIDSSMRSTPSASRHVAQQLVGSLE